MCVFLIIGSPQRACEMTTQSLPAASLRAANRLPAARVLILVSNYLICWALLPIRRVISGAETSLLPDLREAGGAHHPCPRRIYGGRYVRPRSAAARLARRRCRREGCTRSR